MVLFFSRPSPMSSLQPRICYVKKMCLIGITQITPWPKIDLKVMFHDAVRLQSLYVSDTRTMCAADVSAFNCPSLTHLHIIHDLPPTKRFDFYAPLRDPNSFPKLKHLSVATYKRKPYGWAGLSHRIPSLESFSFGANYGVHLDSFCRLMIGAGPNNLTRLHVVVGQKNPYKPWDLFADAIADNCVGLKDLELLASDDTDELISGLCKESPEKQSFQHSIEKIKLSGGSVTIGIAHHLTRLPNLKSFHNPHNRHVEEADDFKAILPVANFED